MTTATGNADVPSTMRASVLVSKGQVRDEERRVPVPADDEVLVKVASVGVCGSDVHYYGNGRIGAVRRRRAAGARPRVLRPHRRRSARGCPKAAIGDRVAIEPQRPCRVLRASAAPGRYNLCPYIEFYATPPIDGAFAEYVTIQATSPTPCRTRCPTTSPR